MKTVLFVCEGNTFRSVIAEAIFNANAPSGWNAKSAGITAGVATSPAAIELLRAIGIERRPQAPRAVDATDVEGAAFVVTFGCRRELPGRPRVPVDDWPVPGGMGRTPQQREEIRDEILERVAGLIRGLTSGRP